MDTPSIPKVFTDNGSPSRKNENFQHFLFQGLDLRNKKEPISFFRGDFRGVTMEKMHFWKNDFDRADFVNASITDSTFEECHFGTDFTNTIFERVKFKSNIEDTCAFFNCSFINCDFESEKITKTTSRNCEYIQCLMKDCHFDTNAFDDINFSKTSFENITFADMGALNFSFSDCNFTNVAFDPDYVGSYLMKNTSLKGVKYEYRGYAIPLSGNIAEDYKTLSVFYLSEQRYHEAFNSAILFQFNSEVKNSIIPFFNQIFQYINQDSHFIKRLEELERCLSILRFYGSTNAIRAKDAFYIIGVMKEIDRSDFRIKDKIAFDNSLHETEHTLQNLVLEPWLWDSIDPFATVSAEVQIDDDKLEDFKLFFKDYLDQLINETEIPNIAPEFTITEIRKGSLIVVFISYAVAVFGLAKILKSTVSEVYSMRLEFKIQKQAMKMIEDGNTTALKNLQVNVMTVRKIINEPSNDLFKKSQKLSSLFKRFNIYPNTLFDGDHGARGIKK